MSVKRQGRPRKTVPDIIKTMLWYRIVADHLQVNSAYALEKHFFPEIFKKGENRLAINRPCRWDKYRRGIYVPNKYYVDLVEEECPGTRLWIEHPLWEIIKQKDSNLVELYNQLSKLRPEVTEILFREAHFGKKKAHIRKNTNEETLKKLTAICDLDSFTACIGLIQESDYTDNSLFRPFCSRAAFTIFKNTMAFLPFHHIACPLYRYIKPYFINEYIDDAKWIQRVENFNITKHIELQNYIILYFEDMGVLGYSSEEQIFFLNIMLDYLGIELINKILVEKYFCTIKEFHHIPEVIKLIRRLKNWRKTNLH